MCCVWGILTLDATHTLFSKQRFCQGETNVQGNNFKLSARRQGGNLVQGDNLVQGGNLGNLEQGGNLVQGGNFTVWPCSGVSHNYTVKPPNIFTV